MAPLLGGKFVDIDGRALSGLRHVGNASVGSISIHAVCYPSIRASEV
ncbi:hypothetical protein ZOD2009_02680 [Haladaptatus paucihalophilus DX253]|uniref:Uncharacterized protein n=1 Tax=Haladaptatus paucihalophilus DX253 TaxID=797209 RepID=E7QP97_HALPU|nr:hypothetical protein ZOD2009_02680 [Haladaptatus paucihalophilus DX253]